MRKGQTALEYLMTYGWAILIVIIVVAALYALGLTKPCRWTGTQVTVPGGFSTDRAYIKVTNQDADGDGAVDDNKLQMKLTNGLPDALTDLDLTFKMTPSGVQTVSNDLVTSADPLESGETLTLQVNFLNGYVSVGDCYTIDITGTYTSGGATHDFTARITGVVESGTI
ncbi:MAG: hypothetical protein QXS48_04715 [Candidatus Aenigmatarchaeota archaeon]